jgi:hypothetical protein
MRILTSLMCLLGLTTTAVAQQQRTGMVDVDLELVLAVDISYSMDMDELRLQRDGYVTAITSKPVLDAIRQGIHGKIAVAYVEWAGSNQQKVILDWTLIDGPETAGAFADRLAETAPSRAYRTSISTALTFSAPLFDKNAYNGLRRVIDVSGDGPNNQGILVTQARDMVVAQGISINGLPLSLKAPNSMSVDVDDLEGYYRDCVIGGPGAFVVSLNDKAKFAEAIREKLVLEISDAMPPPKFIPTQAKPTNCAIGEQIWRDRYGDANPDWQ